jgi:hypothetical protein
MPVSVQFLQHSIPVAATNGYTSMRAGSMAAEECRSQYTEVPAAEKTFRPDGRSSRCAAVPLARQVLPTTAPASDCQADRGIVEETATQS